VIALYLRRGMAAGLLAGLLAGLFAFVVGEPLLDRAIGLEELAHATHNHAEVFGRSTQKVGLFFATGFTGTFVGGLFGLAFAYFRARLVSESDWTRSLSLAAAIFAGAVLFPFLKYPANPPTVGDPATIGARTTAYFVMVGLSLLAVFAAWYASGVLKGRGVSTPVRHVTVGLGLAAAVTALFVTLPATANPGDFPAGLLWSFRLSSLGTQLVLWTGLGVFFGALCERAGPKGAL
jgi:hypothetical protein